VWSDGLVAVAAIVGVLVSAGWLVSGSTRHLRQLQSEVQVWANLPEGDGREILGAWLDESTRRYVHHRRFRWPKRWLWTAVVNVAVLGVTGVAGLVCAVTTLVVDDPPTWARVGAIAGAVIAVLGVVIDRFVRPFADGAIDRVTRELGAAEQAAVER